jgi:hypothetical protein
VARGRVRPALRPSVEASPASSPSRRAALAGLLAAAPTAAGAQILGDQTLRGQDLKVLLDPPGAGEAMSWRFAGGARETGWLPLAGSDLSLELDGWVNGVPVRLVLDSGASVSLVDAGLARRLGVILRRTRPVRDGVGQVSAGADLKGVTFDLPGLSLDGGQVVAVDLSGFAEAGRPATVVLGRQLFEALIVQVDLPGRRVRFTAPDAFRPEPGARAVPLTPAGHQQRSLPVAVEGAVGLPAQFDLGSQSALVASEAFAAAHGWLSGRPTSTWIAATVGGIRPERTATVRGLTLAGVELPPAPLETSAAWDAPDLPLVLGLPTLGRFRLAADYGAQRLWLTPDANAAARPFRKDRAGLAVRPAGAALEVLHVARGSPADAGGWRVGERIVRVDGAPAGARSGFGSGPAGRACRLDLAGGEARTLVLADYF